VADLPASSILDVSSPLRRGSFRACYVGFPGNSPKRGSGCTRAHVQGVLESLRSGHSEIALTYDLDLGADILFEPLVEVPLHCRAAGGPIGWRAGARLRLADLAREPLVLLGLPQSREYFLSVFYALRLEPRIA